MRIIKIAANATDYETLYKHISDAWEYLDKNYVGLAKVELKRAKRKICEMRPDLKNIGRRYNGFLA